MNKKKILFYSHFYKPETGAAVVRTKYFVDTLRNAGYEVLVVTPKPNYSFGKILPAFKGKAIIKDETENVTYLPIFFTGSHSPFGRLLSYLSYMIISFFYLLFNNFKPDIVITSSPPIFTAFSASVYAKIKKAKFILDIRDIWPDIGIELGILKKGISTKGLSAIEKFVLKRADKIIVTAKGDKENIDNKLKGANKIEIIYNGADTEIFKPLEEKNKIKIRKENNLPTDRKILVYFGSYNHGMNDIETLAEFLASSELRNKNLFFLSIGSGDKLENLLSKIEGKINYKSIKSLPSNEVAKLVAACDISVIPRKAIKRDTGGNIPVKCFESWAAGIPVLLSNIDEAEISEIFDECSGGIRVQPSNVKELQSGLEKLLASDLEELGRKGRDFVLKNFDRKKQSAKLVKIVGF